MTKRKSAQRGPSGKTIAECVAEVLRSAPDGVPGDPSPLPKVDEYWRDKIYEPLSSHTEVTATVKGEDKPFFLVWLPQWGEPMSALPGVLAEVSHAYAVEAMDRSKGDEERAAAMIGVTLDELRARLGRASAEKGSARAAEAPESAAAPVEALPAGEPLSPHEAWIRSQEERAGEPFVCDCSQHFFERTKAAIAAGEPLPWPKAAAPVEELGKLTFVELYDLVRCFDLLPGTEWDRSEHRRYVEETTAIYDLRMDRLRKTMAMHVIPAIEGESEDLAVLLGLLKDLPYEQREELLHPLRKFDPNDWGTHHSAPLPDDTP